MGYFDKIYLHEKKTGNLLDITRLDKEHYECFLETVVRIRDNYYREIERGATFDTGDRQLTIPDVSGSIFTKHEIQLIHFALLNFPEQTLSKRTNGHKEMQRLADKVLKLL